MLRNQFIPKENNSIQLACVSLNIPPSSFTSCCSDRSRPSKICWYPQVDIEPITGWPKSSI